LEQEYGTLCRATPHELATFPLTILHVNIAAGILQAAVLKRAVNEHSFVEHEVLSLKSLVLVSVHC
jgi:hypothetical protein